jgi:hypothetical protein
MLIQGGGEVQGTERKWSWTRERVKRALSRAPRARADDRRSDESAPTACFRAFRALFCSLRAWEWALRSERSGPGSCERDPRPLSHAPREHSRDRRGSECDKRARLQPPKERDCDLWSCVSVLRSERSGPGSCECAPGPLSLVRKDRPHACRALNRDASGRQCSEGRQPKSSAPWRSDRFPHARRTGGEAADPPAQSSSSASLPAVR